jgi:hypothetical protein
MRYCVRAFKSSFAPAPATGFCRLARATDAETEDAPNVETKTAPKTTATLNALANGDANADLNPREPLSPLVIIKTLNPLAFVRLLTSNF